MSAQGVRRGKPLRARDQVFGQQVPGNSFLHRTPAGVKLACLAAALIVVMIMREPLVNLSMLLLVLVMAAIARIPAARLFGLLRRVWLLFAVILIAQLIFNDLASAAEMLTRMLAALMGAHLMILTTPIPALLAVVRVLVSPLRVVGLEPGKVVLAAMVMLRAIPYLADQLYLAQRQAKARGLERSIRARVVPVVLASVLYARDTGRALSARGIDTID